MGAESFSVAAAYRLFRRGPDQRQRHQPGGLDMREYVWLECTACGARNYRTEKETRGADRLERKKYCRKEKKHTLHKESRKK